MDVVVIPAVATTAAIALIIGVAALFSRWRRNRYRISLRAVLLLFVLVSLATYAILHHLVPLVAHRRAVNRIYISGGAVLFRADFDSNSGQFYSGVDSNPWGDVLMVHVRSNAEAAGIAPQLKHLPEVEVLNLGGVTDHGLIEICNSGASEALETINLLGSPVTAKGLSRLADLKQLRTLLINTCPIDDQALAELKDSENIQNLTLLEEGKTRNPNRFTETGFESLSRMTGLEYLFLAGIRITPESASHLKRMTQLKRLRVSRHLVGGPEDAADQSLVSDEIIADIHRSLPNCQIEIFPRDQPTESPDDSD